MIYNKMRIQIFILCFVAYVKHTISVTVYPPVWVTSNFIKSDSKRIIDAATTGQTVGPSQTPTATMPFAGLAFSLTPNIGYGISGYQGMDSFYSEKFQVNMTGITTSSFSVKIQISGTTDLYTLQIRYIAIDRTFPHHLNSFDNVPVNYMNGNLTNLTTRSSSLTYYTNTINYTTQASTDNLQYRQFQPPLADNKILLFMTSLFIQGDNAPYSLDLQVTATILTNETYRLNVSFGYRCNIERLHFSMIMFDQYDVERTGKYLIVYERIGYGQGGGFYAFQSQFMNNFMIGLTDIGAPRILSLMCFYTKYQTQSGSYGVLISPSISRNGMYLAANRYGVSIFYLKTWICPNQSFFQPTLNQCVGCSLPYCIDCLSLTTCNKCDILSDYMLNTTTGLCYTCGIKGCINCTSIQCIDCNQNLNYILKNGTCQRCKTQQNYFINITVEECQLCVLDHCVNCSNLYQCGSCDIGASYYKLGNNLCAYCDNAMNYFINLNNLNCQHCTPTNCLKCSSLTECEVCNVAAMYLLNATDHLCYLCTLSNCVECETFTKCRVCDEGNRYYRNETTGLCELCVLEGCLNCTSLEVCGVCDLDNGYGHDFTSANMTLCGECNVSCVCDGYGMPWDWKKEQCTPFCGDGLIRVEEECDDNNTDSGDGCSSLCVQQQYYNCTGEPSNCTQTLFIQAQFMAIQKQGCNGFKITTRTPDFALSEISENIFILNEGVTITKTEQNESFIEIHAEYARDIANEQIIVHFSPGQILNITYSPLVPALFYDHSQCLASDQIEKMLEATQIISYAILIISILSCKIVGLELFGVLQLSYFTLSSHSFLNVYLSPLTKFRTFNGLNVGITPETSELPTNYQQMGVAGSFINNCNVMLFVLFGELVLAILFYILTKIIRSTRLEKIALRLLKQGFITLVLFNIFNISFSAGVHWEYAKPSDPDYILSSIILFGTVAAMVISVTAMQLTSSQDYGQFKNKYKKVWICQLYIPLTVVYRMTLGFYSAVQSDYDQSTLIILGFSLAFLLYTIVNLPFTNVYQNYRCCLIHITMLFTLFTTNYYRTMKSNTPMQIKGRIYTPALIQLILMVSCIVVSFFVLIYQIYQMIKHWRNKKKTQNSKQERRSLTQQSFAQIN